METPRKERFKQLFQRYYPVLCSTAHGYLADAADCEDVVQELFVSVWNRGKDNLPDDELAAYFIKAVRNNCITLLRHRQRMETVSMEERAVCMAEQTVEQSPMETKTTDYALLLDEVLAALPPKCRDVFMMSKLQKMKYREIAMTLNVSEKTVENHMGKAFKIIRAYAATHAVAMLLATLFYSNLPLLFISTAL